MGQPKTTGEADDHVTSEIVKMWAYVTALRAELSRIEENADIEKEELWTSIGEVRKDLEDEKFRRLR
jgi:hypothetical protein